MGALVLRQFGGIFPSVSPRALADEAAQTNDNMLLSTVEFRPQPADGAAVANANAISDPLTIYRYPPSQTALAASAGDVNVFLGPDKADTLERAYRSYNNGSAPPEVLDNLGGVRRLGVPKPTDAPAVTVNVVDEFTVDERSASINSIVLGVKNSVTSMLVPSWLGAPPPGDATPGYVNVQDISGAAPTQAYQARVFKLTSRNGANDGTVENTFVSSGPDAYRWLTDPVLGALYSTANATSPAWEGYVAGNAPDYIWIPFTAYGKGFTVNVSGLTTLLSDIEMPGMSDGTKLLTTDQVTEVMAAVDSLVTEVDAAGEPKVNALAAKVRQFKTLVDTSSEGTKVATTEAFYATTDITTLFTTAVANAAQAIWNQAFNASVYQDFTGSGA